MISLYWSVAIGSIRKLYSKFYKYDYVEAELANLHAIESGPIRFGTSCL